jgi:hypothetical protein
MKRRLKWIIPAILFAALIGWLIFIFLKPSVIKPEATYEIATPKPSPQALPENLQKPQQPGATPDLSIYKTDPKWIWWNEQMERDPKFEWKMPINFYGKVVDQSNQPVGGVEIVFQWTDLSDNGTTEQTVLSSDDGRFNLTSVTGKNLGIIRMFKEGYYRVRQGTQANFEYAAFFEPNYHQPDASKPVVYRLRKAGEIPKELVARETMMGIAPTGQPNYIDLRTTRKSGEAQADIAIRITRLAPKEQKRYDWSASIEGVNGAGLIESDDEFMFEAPQDGYKPAYSYNFAEGSPYWGNTLKRKYYIMAKGGQVYGRLEVEFFPKYQNTAAIAVKFIVNPTGSKNLEYTPNTVLPR